MNQVQDKKLACSAEEALFEKKIQGLATVYSQNERPPQGLLGKLDWYFYGVISQWIRQKKLTGILGECVYLPLQRKDSLYHLFILGVGQSTSRTVPLEGIEILKKNLLSIQFSSIAISKSDFGNLDFHTLFATFKGVSLWIAP